MQCLFYGLVVFVIVLRNFHSSFFLCVLAFKASTFGASSVSTMALSNDAQM